MPPDAAGLGALDRAHEDLDELLLQHQERLLALDRDGAARLLGRFAAGFALHLRQEDERLLPAYARLCGAAAPRGGSPAVFALEHRRLAQLLDGLVARVAALPPRPAPRAVLRLLERETTFRHVLEHHVERERSILYPELDRRLPGAERDALVRRCLAEWSEQPPP